MAPLWPLALALCALGAAKGPKEGSNRAEVLQRIERLESLVAGKANASEVLSLDQFQSWTSNGSGEALEASPLTKEEVHEKFRLFHEQKAKELLKLQREISDLHTKVQSLESQLLQKPDNGKVMSKKEIHELFRLFHEALPEACKANKADQDSFRVHLSDRQAARPSSSSDAEGTDFAQGDVTAISRAEVHERFRLFHESLGPSLANCRESKEPPKASGWFSWLLGLGIMSLGGMLGLASLCVTLGESQVQHNRLLQIERRLDHEESHPCSDLKDASPALQTKVLSGAAGAALGSATGGLSGTVTGGALGAAVGLVPAVFTFGLSVPLGAAVGSGLGLVTGSVMGGSTGAYGGVRAAHWYKARKEASLALS